MSGDWDFYFALVNDIPSSIFVDLSLHGGLPVTDKPRLHWVWVNFNAPRADGLLSGDESPELMRIEDRLVPAVESQCGALFVGRITGAGQREFYFYSAADGPFETVARAVLAEFPAYRHETGAHDDPSWSHYLDLLYPTAQEMSGIQNRRVLDQLEKHGDDHAIARAVDHWAHFKSRDARAKFAEAIGGHGFLTVREYQAEDASATFPFTLHFRRSESVEGAAINDLTLGLAELAARHDGDYDGWETQVMRSQ